MAAGDLIISIDPGKSTGVVAMLRPPVSLRAVPILETFTEKGYEYEMLKDLFKRSKERGDFTVYIENPPARGDNMKLVELVGKIISEMESLGIEYHKISPGAWKPIMKKLKVPFPESIGTRHEKDAYLMGVFALSKFQGWSFSEPETGRRRLSPGTMRGGIK